MERIGLLLAGRLAKMIPSEELEERVQAVVERVDGLEDRVGELEARAERQDNESK